ncbi:MAG: response regulator [Myxococcaceae bacterium]|nr:response regulator [Myxococcaceae bacterium]
MPRVMTVDDSRAVRSIITKQLAAMHCEVEEAEDGAQALTKLQGTSVDLILLDVTMPVMDGPTMLAQLRKSGSKTPVIMLTSESKSSVIGDAMRQGIDDYILKPFKAEELVDKVKKSLKLTDAPAAAAVSSGSAVPGSGQPVDVLLIDDVENVAKRLRTLLNPQVSMLGVASAQAALAACREHPFKVILVDYEFAEVANAQFVSQLKLLCPGAAIIAMPLKPETPAKLLAEVKAKGFSDCFYKPFSPESVEDFSATHFDRQDFLVRKDDLLTVSGFVNKPERFVRYFGRLEALFPPALEGVASDCFSDAFIDLSAIPPLGEIARVLAAVAMKAKALGVGVKLIGPPELRKVLNNFEETKAMALFSDLSKARSA